mmetsp:Transcript_60093/g.113312  ORF Transcript_60093/g.113312 Transcript_60093/m.113312 type:complete len:129 (+) Transcript_60093:29-415(+)
MTKKRRNGGRSRHGRGHTRMVDCAHCSCKPAKDKAVKRYQVRNMVDSGAMNDLKIACAYDLYTLPKFYTKNYYCISCAVHSRIVRVRNAEARRNRDPPQRFRRNFDKKPDQNKAGGAAGAARKPAPAA